MTSSPTCTGKLWGSSQQHLCASDPFPAHLLTCTFQGIPGHHQVLSLTSQWSLIRAHLSHRDFCAVLASPRLSLCTEGPCPCLPLKMKSWASQWHNPGASPRPRLCSIPLPVWHLHFRYQHKSQIKLQFSPPLTQVCFSIPCAGKGSPTRTALPGWVLAPPPVTPVTAYSNLASLLLHWRGTWPHAGSGLCKACVVLYSADCLDEGPWG